MERRHPHVFGTARIASAEDQTVAWEEHKRRERAASGQSVLDDVPVGLPALTRASKIGKRVAQVGFEWADISGAIDKVQEEIGELRDEVNTGADPTRTEQEIGDLLFSMVNVCRYLRIDPENALRLTNAKFERRFRYIEQQLLTRGRTPAESTLEEMDALWNEAKESEVRGER
jgi:MazG family protein